MLQLPFEWWSRAIAHLPIEATADANLPWALRGKFTVHETKEDRREKKGLDENYETNHANSILDVRTCILDKYKESSGDKTLFFQFKFVFLASMLCLSTSPARNHERSETFVIERKTEP